MSGLESLGHYTAKNALAEWLREGDLSPLSFSANRERTEAKGVWVEYPVTDTSLQYGEVWDETPGWADRPEAGVRAPAYDECVLLGLRPRYVVDIAIQDKGAILAVIEIVHKHPLTPEKLNWLLDQDVQVWEVPARWVLGQVQRPTTIPGEFRRRPITCSVCGGHGRISYMDSDGDRATVVCPYCVQVAAAVDW